MLTLSVGSTGALTGALTGGALVIELKTNVNICNVIRCFKGECSK